MESTIRLKKVLAQLTERGDTEMGQRLAGIITHLEGGTPEPVVAAPAAKPKKSKAKPKKGMDETAPGSLPAEARAEVGDEVAGLFDAVGSKVYSNVVAAIRKAITEASEQGQNEIKRALREQHGAVGLGKYSAFLGEWKNALMEHVFSYGLEAMKEEQEAEDSADTTTTADVKLTPSEAAKLKALLKGG